MVSSELTLYFMLLMTFISVVIASQYISSPDNKLQKQGNPNTLLPIGLTLFFIWWFGNRQYFGGGYIDSANYAREYISLQPGSVAIDFHSEWIWAWLMNWCKSMGFTPTTFFTIVEAGYLIPLAFAIKKFMPTNWMLGMLFAWSSLFFLPFGVNGIRNGLACHILILSMAFIFEDKYPAGILLAIIAFGIHRSTMLPIGATIMALYFMKNVEYCIYFWLLSIVLSFFGGGFFIGFFGSLGFDDRMSAYGTEQDMSMFSQSGFRWDFLLYSSMPVAMAYYVCVKRHIADNWYNAICVIYLVCNAFWVLVIRASYSNRFAYLSWFIYPLVIAYPLIMLPAWYDQDTKTGYFLLAYVGFTFVMNLYWGMF